MSLIPSLVKYFIFLKDKVFLDDNSLRRMKPFFISGFTFKLLIKGCDDLLTNEYTNVKNIENR